MEQVESKIMNLMKDIKYGWIDKNYIRYVAIDDNFSNNYILQSPTEVIKNKVGVCWDQVELERYYFKKYGHNIKTYFIVHYDGDKCPTHTFLTFEKDKKFYWFEHSWEKFKGIHEYNSLRELLLDVKQKFISSELRKVYNQDSLCLYEYNKPIYHISVQEFYKHCENGKYIDLRDNYKCKNM